MKLNVTRVGLTLGTLLLTAAGSAMLAAGCSDDGTSVPDAAADTTVPDRVDTDVDLPDQDAGSDADAGKLDVNVDAPSPAAFLTEVTRAYCERLRQCCLVGTSQWDQARCESLVTNIGGPVQLAYYSDSFNPPGDAGDAALQINYDPAKVVKCIESVLTLKCGLAGTADIKKIQDDCYAPISGKVGTGQTGCRTSIDCAIAHWCNLEADGGARCEPLKGVNADCTATARDLLGAHRGNEQCTYLANGNPQLYCDIPSDAGVQGKCTASHPVDASGVCLPEGKAACQSNLCFGGTCVNQVVVSEPGVSGSACERLTIKDAGDGG